MRGYYRYLTHKDNPEKAQYNECDISSINGFNIADFVDLTRSELLHIKQSIFSLIQKEDILEYSDLIDFLLSGEMMVELDVASSNTLCLTVMFQAAGINVHCVKANWCVASRRQRGPLLGAATPRKT